MDKRKRGSQPMASVGIEASHNIPGVTSRVASECCYIVYSLLHLSFLLAVHYAHLQYKMLTRSLLRAAPQRALLGHQRSFSTSLPVRKIVSTSPVKAQEVKVHHSSPLGCPAV